MCGEIKTETYEIKHFCTNAQTSHFLFANKWLVGRSSLMISYTVFFNCTTLKDGFIGIKSGQIKLLYKYVCALCMLNVNFIVLVALEYKLSRFQRLKCFNCIIFRENTVLEIYVYTLVCKFIFSLVVTVLCSLSDSWFWWVTTVSWVLWSCARRRLKQVSLSLCLRGWWFWASDPSVCRCSTACTRHSALSLQISSMRVLCRTGSLPVRYFCFAYSSHTDTLSSIWSV